MTSIRSVYTFTCSQIRDLLVVSEDADTRRGLLKMLDACFKGSDFLFTIDEPTMKKIRSHFEFVENKEDE